jgi:hypothetical protein
MERLAEMSTSGGDPTPPSTVKVLGPIAGLILPGLSLAAWWLFVHWGGSTIRGAAGFLSASFAGPTLLLLGVPIKGGTTRYAIAFVTSAALWLILGAWASRRASIAPVPKWSSWWREFLWLAIPVWLGSLVAYGVGYKLSLG